MRVALRLTIATPVASDPKAVVEEQHGGYNIYGRQSYGFEICMAILMDDAIDCV